MPFPTAQSPELKTEIPGPRSRALAQRLARVESRNVTCLVPNPPIFWERAAGVNVWDVDGNRYLDLTAAFGVASAGHGHPRVVDAVARQAGTLLHGMGDVHPATVKLELLEALAARFPGGGPARSVLGSSGSDAVEAALKTAILATGRPGVVAFEGAYHGLSLGSLDVTSRRDFRDPFAARLAHASVFARYGDVADVLARAREARARGLEIGAVLVEPIQGRGGVRIPKPGFLGELRSLCDHEGWLLIADEVYTGFGRTGRWFACEHEEVVPDLLCVGKGLASGMPVSACIGRAQVMDAWPVSTGEALHTQTFLGHPPGCAAALASLQVLEEEGLVRHAGVTGEATLALLRSRLEKRPGVVEVRGLGLMLGIELASTHLAAAVCEGALRAGLIVLPSGEDDRVLSITPPLCIRHDTLAWAAERLAELLP